MKSRIKPRITGVQPFEKNRLLCTRGGCGRTAAWKIKEEKLNLTFIEYICDKCKEKL